jgi:hypothetical protein
MVIDGSSGLTYPNSSTQASSSVVLQVVNATYTATVATTSTSYVTSNITVSITPKFATSKILVIASIPFQSTASAQGCLTIYRNNTTDLSSSARGFGEQYGTSEIQAIAGINYLDSPATTSSTSYTIYFRSINGSTMRTCIDNCQAVITLQEIAA